MKRLCFFILSVSQLVAGGSPSFSNKESYIQREIAKDRFSLILAYERAISRERALKALFKRASEITLERGFRFFIISLEEEVLLVKKGTSYAELPSNLYQEKIIEGDGPRGSEGEDIPKVGVFKGYKVEIRCLHKKEKGAKEPCKYVNCQKREGL